MQLQDRDGNEFDVSLLRWGPDGTLGADKLDRAIDEELVGRDGCDMTMSLMEDGVTMASLWYEKAGLEVIDALCNKGLLCVGHRFGREAVALMRRHPDAVVDAAVQCTRDEEGWLCVVRRLDVFTTNEATDADVACAVDIARNFTGRDSDGNWLSQSVSMLWFDKGVNASTYDWRGETREQLPHAHEMDLPKRERR
ncbi:MAG: hypothetical protein Q4A07_00395 [Coriobacteriales bacterium]|nr:hypothetical protein [Coriobacteriales bacterium]